MSKFKIGERVLLLGDLEESKNWSTPSGVQVGVVVGYDTNPVGGYVVVFDLFQPVGTRWHYPLFSVRELTDFHMAMLGIENE